jgi:hypothetical protein
MELRASLIDSLTQPHAMAEQWEKRKKKLNEQILLEQSRRENSANKASRAVS